jgi:hypothetical protein
MKKTRSKISRDTVPLKRPKLEIFGFEAFTQIRPVWVGDLGTGPKNFKNFNGFGLRIVILYFLALSPTVLKNIRVYINIKSAYIRPQP